MISHAAATDIPMAQPIIPPKMAAVRWRKIVKIFLKYNRIYSKTTTKLADWGMSPHDFRG